MPESTADTRPHAFNPPSVITPHPTYSQTCATPLLPASKLITLAGQTGIHPTTGDVPRNFVEQARLAYVNVINCLKATNATPRDIIHVRHYIVKDTGDEELDKKDIVHRGWDVEWMKMLDEHAGGHRPPDTVLAVNGLATKELLYEVECWAIIHLQ